VLERGLAVELTDHLGLSADVLCTVGPIETVQHACHRHQAVDHSSLVPGQPPEQPGTAHCMGEGPPELTPGRSG
jgi:hypothetical protein